jgi:SAM-dependent methyltransferase
LFSGRIRLSSEERARREAAFRDSYLDDLQASSYRDKFRRGPLRRLSDRRERNLVRRLLDRSVGYEATVLDVPSGAGRFSGEILRRSRRTVAGDSSGAMLRLARRAARHEDGWLGGVQLSAKVLPFRDGSFDCVVCIRFLHHFPTPEERREILASLRRVTRDAVLVSFFASGSVQALRRRMRRRSSGRHAVSRRSFRREARDVGLRVEAIRHSFFGWSEWAVALLRRVPEPSR